MIGQPVYFENPTKALEHVDCVMQYTTVAKEEAVGIAAEHERQRAVAQEEAAAAAEEEAARKQQEEEAAAAEEVPVER